MQYPSFIHIDTIVIFRARIGWSMSIPWWCPPCWWLCTCPCSNNWLTISGLDEYNPCTWITMSSKSQIIDRKIWFYLYSNKILIQTSFKLCCSREWWNNKETEVEILSCTSSISIACHVMPPPVAKSIKEIPRAPRVSNLPCPEI